MPIRKPQRVVLSASPPLAAMTISTRLFLKVFRLLGLDYLFETLMSPSYDEPYAQYGLIAESVAIAEDHSAVTFTLRKDARFHDGTAITADDVVFSFRHHHAGWASVLSGVFS